MVTRRLSDPARAGSQTHAQMLSFEDSAIRVAACFWQADRRHEEIGRERTGKRDRAWIGIDWADEKHDVSVYDVASGKQEAIVIRQTPEGLQEWLGQLRSRYTDGYVAVVL